MSVIINNIKDISSWVVFILWKISFLPKSPLKNWKCQSRLLFQFRSIFGAPAKPVVEQREKVKVGQVIASSAGFVSANIHATIAGTVAKIDKVMDSTGYKRDCHHYQSWKRGRRVGRWH